MAKTCQRRVYVTWTGEVWRDLIDVIQRTQKWMPACLGIIQNNPATTRNSNNNFYPDYRFYSYTFRVNSRYFLHVFLLLALCFSQMAANTHVVSHMLTADDRGVHADAVGIFGHDHGHDHHLHHDQIDTADAADSENRLSDCAIYHAYLGMGGLLSVHCNIVSVPRSHLAVPQSLDLAVAKAPVETQPIRGPPLSS